MNYYKDYSYVESILKMKFSKGYKLYYQCVKRVEIENEEKLKEKYWDLFIIEVQNGYTGTFEEYFKSKTKKTENIQMTNYDKDQEEKRIMKRVENMDESRLKKKVIKT